MTGYGTHPPADGACEAQEDKPSARPISRTGGRQSIRERGLVLFFIGIASGAVALTILVTPTQVRLLSYRAHVLISGKEKVN
jgi:hypothetical protein